MEIDTNLYEDDTSDEETFAQISPLGKKAKKIDNELKRQVRMILQWFLVPIFQGQVLKLKT